MSLKRISQELMQNKRKNNRKAIFSLNRRFNQHILSACTQRFFDLIPNPTTNQFANFTEDRYRGVIETVKYERGDIFRMIQMIEDDNILKVYQGVIGLSSFQRNLISRETEGEVFGSGIIKKLLDVINMHDQPFLQLRSLEITKILAQNSSWQMFRINFLINRFPEGIFVELLKTKQNIIYQKALTLLNELQKRTYQINTSIQNVPLLQRIENILANQPIIDTIKRVVSFLNKLRINYFFRPFSNKFYSIMNRLLLMLCQRNEVNMISDIITRVNNKLGLHNMLTLISEQSNNEQLQTFLKTIIYLPQKIQITERIYSYKCFMHHLMGIEKNPLMPRQQITNLVISWLLSETANKHSKGWVLAICSLQILAKIISTSNQKQIIEIIHRDDLFEQMDDLLKSGDKLLTRQLCIIICEMIKLPAFFHVLTNCDFIFSMTKYCGSYDNSTLKNCLQSLRNSMNKLKKADQFAFQKIKQIVISNRIFTMIQLAFNQNSSKGMEQIRTYYQNLKTKDGDNCFIISLINDEPIQISQ